MRKIIVFSGFTILFFLLTLPSLARGDTIFSDPSFSSSTRSFNPGDQVYFRLETSNDGDREKILKILDHEKKVLQVFSLERSTQPPFVYTLSFQAPANSGIYYLDIKIQGSQGSVYASQQNINVGQVSDQSVSSQVGEAETVVEIEEKTRATPELQLQEKDQPTPEPLIQENDFSKTSFLGQFFDALFSFFRKIFRLGFAT